MKYSAHISILFVILISFTLGWRFNTSSIETPHNDSSMPVAVDDVRAPDQGRAGSVQHLTAGDEEQQLNPSSQSSSLSAQDKIDGIKLKLAKLAQQLKNGVFIEDLNLQIDDFIAIFKGTDVQEHFMEQLKVISLIQGSPELYTAFLDRYPSLPEEDQWLVESLLLGHNSVGNKFREKYIVEKLNAGEHASTWLQVLSRGGIREESTLDFLIEQISYLTDPNDLAAAITASSSIFEPSMASAELAMPRRDDVSDLYQPYFDSEEESVRTAALGTLVSYPRPNEIDIVERALNDQSLNYRHEALNVLMQRPLKATSVQTTLYGIIRNTDEPYYIRHSASIALQINATTRPPQDVIDIANELFSRPIEVRE